MRDINISNDNHRQVLIRDGVAMPDKLGLILVLALIQVSDGDLRREWVPQSMTAAEMWNPWTWYYPYWIAAAESWAEYFKNAQEATNQLYQQWQATGAQNGWWSGGQSQFVPGGGGGQGGGQWGPGGPGGGPGGDPGQGPPGQAPGMNGYNQRPAGQNQGSADQNQGATDQNQGSIDQNQDRADQNQGATDQNRGYTGQNQGGEDQNQGPTTENQRTTYQNQGGADQTEQPAGQYIPSRRRRFTQ